MFSTNFVQYGEQAKKTLQAIELNSMLFVHV